MSSIFSSCASCFVSRCIGRAGSPGDPFLQYVLESLLAALLHLVDVECLGDDQLKKYKVSRALYNEKIPTIGFEIKLTVFVWNLDCGIVKHDIGVLGFGFESWSCFVFSGSSKCGLFGLLNLVTAFIIVMSVPICLLRRKMALLRMKGLAFFYTSDAKLTLKNTNLFGTFDYCQAPTSPSV